LGRLHLPDPLPKRPLGRVELPSGRLRLHDPRVQLHHVRWEYLFRR